MALPELFAPFNPPAHPSIRSSEPPLSFRASLHCGSFLGNCANLNVSSKVHSIFRLHPPLMSGHTARRVRSRCLSPRVQFTRTLALAENLNHWWGMAEAYGEEQLGTVIAPRRVPQWKRSISGVWDGQCTRIPGQTGKTEFQLCFDRDVARPRTLGGTADLLRWPDL